MPARESHQREAPYPKSKKLDKKKDEIYVGVEDSDPLWLKDKGDHFYKRNDFSSAINAYSKSLEFDKDFLMSRFNRATTWLKVRSFEHCVADCDDIENHIMGLKEDERTDEFYQKMLARLLVKRGAGYTFMSKFDEAVKDLEQAIKYKGIFGEPDILTIMRDIERIKVRKQSQQLKQEGD